MFNIDYSNRTPIFEQIINMIERYVALGILKPKEQIMSIRDLAKELGINPNTVKKAYDELEKKGIIKSLSTKGTFISDNIEEVVNNKIDKTIKEIKGQIGELEKLGIKKEDIIKKLK